MKKRTLLTSALCALAVVAGSAASAQAETVMDTISHTPTLSTVTQLVQQAGLAETLRGAGPVTLFAPNDAAFSAMPAAKLAEISADKEQLKALLGFHLAQANITVDSVTNGAQKTASGASISLYKSGTFLTVENAVVVQPDLKASNGVVQVIDTVLVPPKK